MVEVKYDELNTNVKSVNGKWLDALGNEIDLDSDGVEGDINIILMTLLDKAALFGQPNIPEYFKDAYRTLKLEEQLLSEIRRMDKDRDFYYNVPVESNVAIDFTESDLWLNTLMNPALNYDINNVNNSFVTSKLDINYLTKGIQIARSSRIN